MLCADFVRDDLPLLTALEIPGWEKLAVSFGFYLEHAAFCRPRKIMESGRLLAVGALVVWEDSAWLGHILVATDQRRKGLGAEMTRDLITLAQQRGINNVRLLASDLGEPLYITFGFVTRERYVLFTPLPTCDEPIDEEICEIGPSDFPAVLALDRAATGDRRDRLWKRHETPGMGIRAANGALRGVFQPSIGEGVILATDESAGLALLRYKHRIEQPKAVVPAGNHAAIAFLRSFGHAPIAEQAYMTLGDPPSRRPEWIFSRAGGFLG